MKVPTAMLLAVFVGLLTLGAGTVAAQDPSTGLAEAERDVSTYEAELPGLRRQVATAEALYRAAASKAAPFVRARKAAQAEARQLRHELSATEQGANARIARLKERHRHEVDDHDQTVRSGVGFGLAALVAAAIALAWGWFRASAPVAALSELNVGRAIGLSVGAGLLLLIVGAVLGSANGALGALGSFLFCLGLILPTAFLLARHSAQVQRRRSKPLLRRERLPTWVPIATAGLMLILFAAGTGSAIFAGDAASDTIPPRLAAETEALSSASGGQELDVARAAVSKAIKAALAPLATRNDARRNLANARSALHRSQLRLTSARSRQMTFSHRLVALEEKEQRSREKEAERLQQEEEERIEEEEETTSECDPNYSGCLDPYSPDYDCLGGSGDGPDYTGTVEVLGTDHYGLDSDGDGIGCE